MPFALRLQDSLRDRHSRIAREFAAGETLAAVLDRHLLAIEASADTELLTSILLLDETGTRILHGAAPNLPKDYCEAINGAEIGPKAGSCGTAAYTGRATYVTDIATDPLWDDYRCLALPHGLRACWSTPIFDTEERVIGTFAVYHPTPRSPTPGEVESIRLITDHVAEAIMWSRRGAPADQTSPPTHLHLVNDRYPEPGAAGRFHGYAMKLDRFAELVASQRFAAALRAAASECRRLGNTARDGPNGSNDDLQR